MALRWIRGNPTITTTAADGTRQTIENPNFGSATSLLLAVLTLIVTLAVARFAPGFWSRMPGIRTLSRVNFTNSNVLIVAVAIGVGIIPITVPEIYNHIPRVARDDLRVGHRCHGDLRGAPEPRVQPLLRGRRAGAPATGH